MVMLRLQVLMHKSNYYFFAHMSFLCFLYLHYCLYNIYISEFCVKCILPWNGPHAQTTNNKISHAAGCLSKSKHGYNWWKQLFISQVFVQWKYINLSVNYHEKKERFFFTTICGAIEAKFVHRCIWMQSWSQAAQIVKLTKLVWIETKMLDAFQSLTFKWPQTKEIVKYVFTFSFTLKGKYMYIYCVCKYT